MTTDLLAAFALLRLEELRADLRAELEQAARWEVRALPSPRMAVQVGPHTVDLKPSYAVYGAIDTIIVTITDGRVRACALPGVPSYDPLPAVVPPGTGLPLALVHKHAAAVAIRNYYIVPFKEAR
ncbi:hypothetical protein SUDANB95_05498 [Actinosynnema sp. ALI-1.44]